MSGTRKEGANRRHMRVMADRRLSRRYQDETRARIGVMRIIRRVEKCALGELEMTPTQLRAAEVLLRKVLPDLSAVEHNGNVEHKHLTQYTDAELLAFVEAAHRRELRRGDPAAADGALEPARLHAVHDAELEAGEDPPSYQ